MRKFVRFKDLQDAGLVRNWPQLKRMVEIEGFPPGRLLSSNARAWTEDEVDEWIDSRPSCSTVEFREQQGLPPRQTKSRTAQEAA